MNLGALNLCPSGSLEYIGDMPIEISDIVLGVESHPNEIVHDVVETLQTSSPIVYLAWILPQEAHLMQLKPSLIMNARVVPMSMPKSKYSTESDEINLVVPSINHPM